jgi:hypothetical protein
MKNQMEFEGEDMDYKLKIIMVWRKLKTDSKEGFVTKKTFKSSLNTYFSSCRDGFLADAL